MRRMLQAVTRPLVGQRSTDELEERVEVVEQIVNGLVERVQVLEEERRAQVPDDEKRAQY